MMVRWAVASHQMPFMNISLGEKVGQKGEVVAKDGVAEVVEEEDCINAEGTLG